MFFIDSKGKKVVFAFAGILNNYNIKCNNGNLKLIT